MELGQGVTGACNAQEDQDTLPEEVSLELRSEG